MRAALARLRRQHATLLGLLLLALPVGAYFALIAVFDVNTIVYDQWADVALLAKVYSGHAGVAAFWAAHNENRTLVPNLIVVALAATTHLDTTFEAFLSAVTLLCCVVLAIVAHRRRDGVALAWYLPVPVLLMTFAQYASTLFGYQLSWYLALLGIVVALFLLDRPSLGWPLLAGAAGAAVVASFSAFEGLLAWAGGILLIALRRHGIPKAAAWLLCGAATTALYLYHLDLGSTIGRQYALTHPLVGLAFVLVALGDVVGYAVTGTSWTQPTALVLMPVGAAVLVSSLVALGWAVRRGRRTAAPFGAALIVVGLLFTLSAALARDAFGALTASQSRYVTFDVLPLVGSYLVWLSRRRAAGAGAVAAQDGGGAGDLALAADRTRAGRRPLLRRAAPLAVLAVALLPAPFGLYHGIEGGRSTRHYDEYASDVIVNIRSASDDLVELDVYPLVDPSYVRALQPVAERHRLSLFDTAQFPIDRARGLDVGVSFPLFPDR